VPISSTFWRAVAGINGFIALAMGAVGSHVIQNAPGVSLAEKASLYELIHAVALLALASITGRFMKGARWLFLLGMVLFCFPLYVKALTGWDAIVLVAPLGGIGFMIGWLFVAIGAGSRSDPS